MPSGANHKARMDEIVDTPLVAVFDHGLVLHPQYQLGSAAPEKVFVKLAPQDPITHDFVDAFSTKRART